MSTTPNEKQHPQPKLTVAGSAQSCVESFQDCLNKASNADKITSSPHPKPSLVRVEDQLARFSLWTANIRVFGPGRSSLDHRLREAHDVQNAVIGVLQAVNYRVKTCSRILESISSRPDEALIQTPLKELDEVLEGLKNEISLLHKISNTIRRASKDTQNLNAAKTFKIEDDQGNDTGVFLQQLFTNYIRDRFPGTSDNLRERLANSMVLRRKRILYRRARYGKTSIRAPEVVSKPVISHPRPEPTVGMAREPVKRRVVEATARSAVPSTTQTATTLSPEKFQRASNPSVISVSKTVALSSHDELSFPPAPCGGLMRRYNRLKREKEDQHRAVLESIPGYEGHGKPPPHYAQLVLNAEAKKKEALAKDWQECLEATVEVTCPFCFYALPVQDAMDERKWKLHVKNDLDPYVCLFEDCDSAELLYSHSDVWLKHMKEHALRWRCTAKSHGAFAARTRDEYLNHMKTSHPGKFTDAQLSVLADRNARLPGPLFKSCPLCGIEEVDGSMEDHVVGHMRFLALKSLPAYEDDTGGLEEDESGNEQDSLATSRPRSRSTIRNDPDKDTELFFDDPGGNELERTTTYHASWDENQIEQQGFLNRSDPPSSIAVLHDPSAEFDAHSEWGFIPDIHESFEDMTADPIVRDFLDRQLHRTIRTRSNWKPANTMDPDCAICHAPALAHCDCEAKGLDVAVKQAEERMMSSLYHEVRTWVREKSQQFIRGHFHSHLTTSKEPEKSREEQGQRDSSAQASKIQEPSQQEVSEAWQESVQQYPVTLEYFFGLVEYTLPAEDEPCVKDPPLRIVLNQRGHLHTRNGGIRTRKAF